MSDSEASNLTQCPACKKTYTDPVLLPCLDTLCKQCFFAIATSTSEAADSSSKQQVRKCPVCSSETSASGTELKPDSRAAWIVRTRQAELERQQRETAKGRCSLPHCGEQAVSKGFYFEGNLCSAHVKTDGEKFAEIKLTAQSLLQSVRGLTQKRRDALTDLQAEKADAAELLDGLEARLQRCRLVTLGRLDLAIDKLKLELRAVEFIEKLQVQIQDAERVGDQVLSSRLFKQLHLSLADVDVTASWASSAGDTVELIHHLLASINMIAADIESGRGVAYSRSSLELRDPACQELTTRGGVTPFAAALCNRTDGYYGNSETGAVASQCQPGMHPLPPRCIVAVGKKEAVAGYFAAAPVPRELIVQYFDVFGRFCGQFSIDVSPSASLVAFECSSGLQRLFVLTNSPEMPSPQQQPPPPPPPPTPHSVPAADSNTSPQNPSDSTPDAAAQSPQPPQRFSTFLAAPSPSEVIVTDLAGSRLLSLRDFHIGGPARGIACCGDHLSTACVYVLGNGLIACVAAESGQTQESIKLTDEAKEARSLAASGRKLLLVANRSVYLVNTATKAAPVRLLTVADNGPDLRRAVNIGCGYVAIADAASKWVCLSARSGNSVRAFKGGPAEAAACVARLEYGLKFFALKK